MIHYTITSLLPSSHIFNVTLRFTPSKGQQLIMPTWIPGSYMQRDFAKQVVQLNIAKAYDEFYQIKKVNSYTWQIEKIKDNADNLDNIIIVEYEVYAWDRSVRGSHLDTTHAFINFSCLALMVVGQENARHYIQIEKPILAKSFDENAPNWSLATSLSSEKVDNHGFGLYCAQNYDELIDNPVEMGILERISFSVHNAIHDIVISGVHYGDTERLKQDVEKICQVHQDLFQSTPFEKYCFLLTLVGEGYGGLEHRNSTALLSSRTSMPRFGLPPIAHWDEPSVLSGLPLDYQNLLGLFSHEYFHVWNVKRIKPQAFCPYDLTQPQYTRQLWAFEGITAYYDILALVRAKVISFGDYFQLLSEKIVKLQATPGRNKQNLSDASFDAWIKFYKPDENTPNSSISYYLKGMLVAFCIDMMLREQTNDACSLDDMMRSLWGQYGDGSGVPEGELENTIVKMVANQEYMRTQLDSMLNTTEPLPIDNALQCVGLQLEYSAVSEIAPALGMIIVPIGSELLIANVLDSSAAMKAGLSAKDMLIAINNIRVNSQANVERLLAFYQPEEHITVSVFREDKLMCFNLQIPKVLNNKKAKMVINPQAEPRVIERRNRWLKGGSE